MLSVCTTSIGSSIVTMCARRVRLMNPISAAIVVVLPAPVGPVTSTSPRFVSASERIVSGRWSCSNVRSSGLTQRIAKPDRVGLTEDADAEPPDPFEV